MQHCQFPSSCTKHKCTIYKENGALSRGAFVRGVLGERGAGSGELVEWRRGHFGRGTRGSCHEPHLAPRLTLR